MPRERRRVPTEPVKRLFLFACGRPASSRVFVMELGCDQSCLLSVSAAAASGRERRLFAFFLVVCLVSRCADELLRLQASFYAAARPQVTIQNPGGAASQTALPAVFLSPIRSDLVNFVHTQMAKNHRQAYGVYPDAGHETAAISWGTGRAVSRIPRVPGSGTSRSGQGAFGNMCRGGRMFAPTRTWRRWHRKINKNQKRYAVTSAIAASALTSLVQARGHRIEQVAEVPLVVADAAFAGLQKTKQAVALLKALHAYEDVEKVIASKRIHSGRGKARNRRYKARRGPLVVTRGEQGNKALRNIPGVEIGDVTRLNLLTLAPGGHVGRFVVWTESAFKYLAELYGNGQAATLKKGFALPRPLISNADIGRTINSDEVQSVLRPARDPKRRFTRKVNPLTNKNVMLKLNPYEVTRRRKRVAQEAKVKAAKAAAPAAKAKAAPKKKVKTSAYAKLIRKLD